MNHQTLFPGFVSDDEDRKLKAAGLKDNSWGNDAVPFFGLPNDDEGNLQLGIDHPVDGEREHPGGPRIFIIGPPDSPDLLWGGEDLAQGIAEFQRIAGQPGPVTALECKAAIWRNVANRKLSPLVTRFALKWKLQPGQTAEQFVGSSAGLGAVYAALDAIQQAHPELIDYNYESTEATTAGPATGATMIAATRLLADLGATFEHPGFISIVRNGIEYCTGDVNGPFGCDFGPVDSGAMRQSHATTIPATSTPEQLAAYIRSIIPK